MAKFRVRRTGENLVTGHLAVRIHGHIDQQAMRQREFEVLLLGRPGLRIVRKGNQFGGAHEIEINVVLDGAHDSTRHYYLEHQHKNQDGGEKSAGGRHGQRTENVVEQNFGAVLDTANAAGPIPRMLRLSGSDFNADGEIGRRNVFGDTRKHNRQLAEALQFLAANVAPFEVLPNLDALCDARSAGDCIIEITSEFSSYRSALHGRPSPAELARGDFDSGDREAASVSDPCKSADRSEESETRRAAENASPKGDGRASETLPCEAVC